MNKIYTLNNKYLNICNLYMVLWGMYYIQGIFYPMGSIFPRTCLVFSLLITLTYWIKAIVNYRLPQPLRVMNILIVVLFLYAGFYQIMGDFVYRAFDGEEYTGIGAIRSLIESLLPVFPVFVFTIKGYLNRKSIRIWTIIFFIVITLQFFAYEIARTAVSIYDTDGLTNNIAYYFVALLPMVLLFSRKKIIMYLILLYLMFFIMYGMKRGAIMIGAFAILYIILKDYKNSTTSKKILIILLFSVVVIAMCYFIYDLLSTSDYFRYRVEQTLDGSTSGRDSYYEFLWNSFINEQNIIKILFGGGYYNTVRINGNLAHNDWLEILINQGLIGVLLFSVYWMSWFKYIKQLKGTEYFPIMACFFGIFVSKTVLSMSITDTLVYGMLPVGYCMGRKILNEKL